jgi:protein arginine N-methyltransferase 1
MPLVQRVRPFVQSGLDKVFDVAATRVRRSAMGYRRSNRMAFTRLQGHELMLADAARVNAYAEAVPRVVTRTDTVLDLGTGTGVLVFLAARAGARLVHAVDHSSIIDVARAVAESNGLDNVVFHQTHSGSLSLDGPVDVLLHEQMGHGLFEERMVSNIADLRDRLLRPGGSIVPSRFEFFVEPVSLRAPYVVPYIWQQRAGGVDYSVLRERARAQPPDHRRLEVTAFQVDRPLTTPVPALLVDLHTASPATLPQVVEFERPVEAAGVVHGLCVWFRAFLDAHATIDTTPFGSPDSTPTSWRNPFLRLEEPITVTAGDRLHVRLEAGTLESLDTWDWTVRLIRP